MSNCLLLTKEDSDVLTVVKQLCERKDIFLNYTTTIVSFFERYYELHPKFIIVDCSCDCFLMREAMLESPMVFYNSIFICPDKNSFRQMFPNYENMVFTLLSDLEEVIDDKIEINKKVVNLCLDSYDGKVLNNKVIDLMNEIGFKQNLKGYSILKELVLCSCSNRFRSISTMTEKYEIVERRLDISTSCLERNIRTEISRTYNKEHSLLKELFPFGKPTNKQITNYLVEKLITDIDAYHEKMANNLSYYSAIVCGK